MADDWGSSDTGASAGAGASAGGGDDWGSGGDWSSSAPSSDNKSAGRGRGGGDGKRACFKCGDESHMSRECPQAGNSNGGSKGCFKCGETGHMSRECPQAGSGGGSKGCFNCGESGHMSRECPQPKKQRDMKDMKCRTCNEMGHMSRDCPSKPASGGTGGGDWGDSSSSNKEAAATGEGEKKENENPNSNYRPEHVTADADEATLYGTDSKVSAGINFAKYDAIPVKVSGENQPPPIKEFKDAISSNFLLEALSKAEYRSATPIQKYAVPMVLAGRDLMACAQTGSGKTAAFLLPILQSLLADSNSLESGYGKASQEPLALVIAPTRELAIQIYVEAVKFSRGSVVLCQLAYGGTSTGYQKAQLSKGTHLLVATPGRLLGFVESGLVSLGKLKFLVLDEADRLIDDGFVPAIRRVVTAAPDKALRQTLMFSATFPDAVQRLALEFLRGDYLFLAVGQVGGACGDVVQSVAAVEKHEKKKTLEALLDAGDKEQDRIMVFVEAKKTADFLASYLSTRGYKATSIHGDRFQQQREQALTDFRRGTMPVLVATAVAARGLDIKDVRHVINYDLPKEAEEYVHRIGRTGRLGNTGLATSFYDAGQDQHLAPALVKILSDAGQPVPDFLSRDASGSSGGFGGGADGFGGSDIRTGPGLVTSTATVSNDDAWD